LFGVKKNARNALNSELKNKETDVIGRKGSVVTVWVKMLDTSAVVGQEIPRKKSKAEYLLSGCHN
jgi:hypothetical protein